MFHALMCSSEPELAKKLRAGDSTVSFTPNRVETSMQFTPWENPMGTDGFEFVEYAAPDPAALGRLFETMGFTAIARHRHKRVTLYRQGEVNYIINAEPNSFAQRFARQHGPSVCAMAFQIGRAHV